MKIILSRKGFDSSYGGYPSPILPDGRLISLPIPSSDSDTYEGLHLDGYNSYYDLMKSLKPNIRYYGSQHVLRQDTRCHLDPDIFRDVQKRDKGWKPMFGQINQSQTHLKNQGVKEDDLFIFFGWFRRTKSNGTSLSFDGNEPDLHVMYGYLQIGLIKQVDNHCNIPCWMSSHPHTSRNRKNVPTNTIYVARDTASWNADIPGAGVFRFGDALILTKKGYSRSKWQLPEFFREVTISRHSAASWNKEGYFKSVDIGQEFVIQDSNKVEDWAKSLIEENQI